MTARLSFALPPLIALLGVACGTDTTYRVRFAPEYARGRHTVSVFGVFKDGQMSNEAWDSLAPRMSSWLGSRCAAGYLDAAATKTSPRLWDAVDDYIRSNGPTDDLLTGVAAAAQGDFVLVLTMAGRTPAEEKIKVQNETPQSAAGGQTSIGGMRNSGGAMTRNKRVAAGSMDALDLAALVYSVSAKKSVAQVSLEYTGQSVDTALASFTDKLRDTLPVASCAGWAWSKDISAEGIAKIGE